jgi:hypothetical protein
MLKDVGLDERVTSDDLKEDIHLILRSPQTNAIAIYKKDSIAALHGCGLQ